MSCPACAHDNPTGARFCNQCGRALAPDGGAGTAPERTGLPRYTPRHLVEKALTTRRALEGERKQVVGLFKPHSPARHSSRGPRGRIGS